MKMLKLAKRVYKDKPEIREKFVYNNLLKEVRGTQPAGLKGVFLAADTNKPLSNVLIRAIDTDYAATSDKDGRYELPMASGVYSIEISAPGYKTVVLADRKIEVGVMHRLNLSLELVPVANEMPSRQALSELLKDVPVSNGVEV